jgi:hypothetical protein
VGLTLDPDRRPQTRSEAPRSVCSGYPRQFNKTGTCRQAEIVIVAASPQWGPSIDGAPRRLGSHEQISGAIEQIPGRGSERLSGIGPMMWERENGSLLLQHLSHMQSERGRCSIRSANLGPAWLAPQLQRPGPFSSVSWGPPPTVSCYRPCAADRTAARQAASPRAWQRRTNVWRNVTSPAREAKRLRNEFAR